MEAFGKLRPQSQILKDWWFEVKENFWQEDAKVKVKMLLKELMEQTMKEEMTQVPFADYVRGLQDNEFFHIKPIAFNYEMTGARIAAQFIAQSA